MAKKSDVFGSVLETDFSGKEYDIKQAFFTNLLVLGFEAKIFELKYRIPFSKDMFNLPNKTGSEAVLYFLFDQLNPIMCKEEFRCICVWPISNKKDEQLFRRACNNWLINIQKEEPDSHLPRVAASLLMSPGGNKFYEFLFSFSNYVLRQVIKRDNGVKYMLGFPELSQKTMMLDDVMGKTVQCSAIKRRKQYFQQLQQNLVSNNEWKEYSSELVKEYRHLTKKIRDLERDVRSEIQVANEKSQAKGSPGISRRRSLTSEYDLDSQSVRRTQRIQKLRDMWKQVERFQSEDRKDKEIIQAILDDILTKNKQISAGINATDLNIKIPDLLLRECETEIHRRHVDNTYKGGKVNILSVIQLWNLSLHLYIERLQNVSSKEIEKENSSVIQQLHTHNAHLINAKGLSEKLSEDLLPELKQSISSLRTELDSGSKHRTPSTSRTMTGFELSTATPPVSFTPQDNGQVKQKPSVFRQTPTQGRSTPEAANEIIDTVLQTSRKTLNRHHQGSPLFIPSTSTSIPVSNRNKNNNKASKSQNSHLPSKPQLKNRKKGSQDTSIKSSTPVQLKRHGPKVSSKLAEEAKIKSSPFPTVKSESRQNTPAKTKRPKSHDILVDKIVSAVVDGTSPDNLELSQSDDLDINLFNPIAALDDGVFISRDKIRRSPEGNDHDEPQPDQQGSQAVFTDNTRLKLSFTDDVEPLPQHSIDLSNNSHSTTVLHRNTITDDNDSGLLALNQLGLQSTERLPLHYSPTELQSTERLPLHYSPTELQSTERPPLHYSPTELQSTERPPLHYSPTELQSTERPLLHYSPTELQSTERPPLHYSHTELQSTERPPLHYSPTELQSTERPPLHYSPTELQSTERPPLHYSPTELQSTERPPLHYSPTELQSTERPPLHYSHTELQSTERPPLHYSPTELQSTERPPLHYSPTELQSTERPPLHYSPTELQSTERPPLHYSPTELQSTERPPLHYSPTELQSTERPPLHYSPADLQWVISSPVESDIKSTDVLKSGRKSDIFGKLNVISEDDLDDIFNTKTPRIVRKSAAINSVSSSFSETDQMFVDRLGNIDSLQDEEPITLKTFSPPKQSTELLVDFNSSCKKQISSSNNFMDGSFTTHLDIPVITTDNSDIENEEFPNILDINESFSPVKQGIKLVGISPGKPIKPRHVSPRKSSADISECRKAASDTLKRFSIEIDDLIAQTDKTIHDKEQLLVTSISDDILMSNLSRKYLNPMSSQHSSLLSPNLLDQDIFAEDDTLLLPVSPNQ